MVVFWVSMAAIQIVKGSLTRLAPTTYLWNPIKLGALLKYMYVCFSKVEMTVLVACGWIGALLLSCHLHWAFSDPFYVCIILYFLSFTCTLGWITQRWPLGSQSIIVILIQATLYGFDLLFPHLNNPEMTTVVNAVNSLTPSSQAPLLWLYLTNAPSGLQCRNVGYRAWPSSIIPQPTANK